MTTDVDIGKLQTTNLALELAFSRLTISLLQPQTDTYTDKHTHIQCCYDHQNFTATAVVGYHQTNTTIAAFCSVLSGLSGRYFLKKSQNCPSRLQSRESSKCHVIWSRVNVAGARERTTVSRSCRHRPPSPVRRPLPHSQTTIHCRDSRDSLGTVLSETVTTVSLSAPPTVPCSEQLAHSRTAGTIWKQRHPPVSD